MLIQALMVALLASAPAPAQESQQDHTVDFELFRPHADAYGYFHTQSAATLGHLQVGGGFWFNHSANPMVLVYDGDRVDPESRTVSTDASGLVGARYMGDVQLGVGLSRHFSLTVDLPLVLRQSGYQLSSVDNPGRSPDRLTSSGLSDVRVNPKLVVADRDYMPIGVALAMPVTLPTGNGGSFLGEEAFTVQPTVVVEFSDGSVRSRSHKIRAAMNLGYKARDAGRLRDVALGNELVYGVGLGVHPVDPLEITLDVHGAVSGPKVAQQPAEALGGIKLLLGRYVSFNLGGGTGIISGIGAPDYRVFAGFTVAPSFDPKTRDRDGDGIPDYLDQCPDEPEDFDGYMDEDGCPDPDNDGDGICDPWVAEQGLSSKYSHVCKGVDLCPNDPEDFDGFEDEDGCPDPDNDKDGIPDIVDQCPNEPEDFDGFQDEDGCPDSDNDFDGVCDPWVQDMDLLEKYAHVCTGRDLCPNLAGPLDNDGCPFEKPRVVVTDAAIEINDVIYFDFGKATIQERSFDLMDEIATVILDTPELKKIRVEGHTDSVGGDVSNLKLSQARAEAVVDYLAGKGVERSRLDPVGFGKMRPITTNETEEGRAANRRVEFIIVSRDLKRVVE